MSNIPWNNNVRLILSDVDQTVAEDFLSAEPEMIQELSKLLKEQKTIFFTTGGPIHRVHERITKHLPAELRYRTLVATCLGAEVWGFDKSGDLKAEPFYSLYDANLSDGQKKKWRLIVRELLSEFKLEVHDITSANEFRSKFGNNPLAIMMEDRGPQITLEFINAYDMNEEQRKIANEKLPNISEQIDLREPVIRWLNQKFQEADLPLSGQLGGTFALDMTINGVSKADAITRIFSNKDVLEYVGLDGVDLNKAENIEIWGDRFEIGRGTDWLMCEAVNSDVRAIDFRQENPINFPEDANIQFWQGKKHLYEGLLEYLQSKS